MSSLFPSEVTLSLDTFRQHGCKTDHQCDGWGLAYYQNEKANLYKEPAPAAFSEQLTQVLSTKQASSLVIAHLRHATQGGRTFYNTQPFDEEVGGRKLILVHNGNLINIQRQLSLSHRSPKGETDSEYAFCYLLEKLAPLYSQGLPQLTDRLKIVEAVFSELAKLGPANFLFSDGDCLFAFANKRMQASGEIRSPGLHYIVRQCHYESAENPIETEAKSLTGVELSHPDQRLALFASVPLSNENWIPFAKNELIVAKNGSVLCSKTIGD